MRNIAAHEVGSSVALKDSEREVLAVEHLFAPQILFGIVEYSYLSKFVSWEAVSGSQLAIFIVSPSVEVSKLINHVPKVLTNRKL